MNNLKIISAFYQFLISSELELAHDNHENEHDEEYHDKHHDEEHDDTHNEYHLSYTINCDSLENLKLEVNLFKNFPGFEHVDLNWINENKQGMLELTPKDNFIEL